MAEQESEKLKRENKELVDRWMARMGEEADAMNNASKFSWWFSTNAAILLSLQLRVSYARKQLQDESGKRCTTPLLKTMAICKQNRPSSLSTFTSPL